jgi:hypothetical protein
MNPKEVVHVYVDYAYGKSAMMDKNRHSRIQRKAQFLASAFKIKTDECF